MVGDRTGALFRPRDGENPIRLLVAPFDGGLMATWLRGSGGDAAAAEHGALGLGSDGQVHRPRWRKATRSSGSMGELLPHASTHAPICPRSIGHGDWRYCGTGAPWTRKNPYEDFEDED